jgi:long-chain acyl-CoA synthetase
MRVNTASWVNVSSVVEHTARMQPQRLAVVCGDQRLTFGQIDAAANRVAHALRRSGIQPGDHVALSCPNQRYGRRPAIRAR